MGKSFVSVGGLFIISIILTSIVYLVQHGGLLLTASSNYNNSLIKSQQRQQQLLGQGDLLMTKMEIKSEKQTGSPGSSTSSSNSSTSSGKSHAHGYGIPLTPPSSLPSDDSEGNLTPEHLFSPLSPNASVSISVANAAGGESSVMVRRNAAGITRSSSGSGSSSSTTTSTTTTRQPIHTPLISSQPVSLLKKNKYFKRYHKCLTSFLITYGLLKMKNKTYIWKFAERIHRNSTVNGGREANFAGRRLSDTPETPTYQSRGEIS